MKNDISKNEFGINNMVMYYEPIYNYYFKSVVAYRSQLRLNTELGVLLPNQYQDIALRSQQGIQLSLCALDIIAADANKLRKRNVYYEWLSFYVPVKLLKKPDLIEILNKVIEKNDILPKDLCFELPGEIMFEDLELIRPVLEKLSDLGVKTMLTDVGNEFCPIMRLFDFKTDYALLDGTITNYMLHRGEEGQEFIEPLIEMITLNDRELIATDIKDTAEAKDFSAKCVMSVGKLAGRLKKIGSIRP